MANGNNLQIQRMVVRSVLGLLSAAIIALASLGYSNIINRLDKNEQATTTITIKLDSLKDVMFGAAMVNKLQDRDILELRKDIEEHIRKDRP